MQRINADLDVSVILPAYNEQETIATVVKKAIRALNGLNCSYEIIVVDDGSTDNTRKEVEDLMALIPQPRLYIIAHRINKGLTAALLTGFRHTRAATAIFLCADLQSDPEEDIPKLLTEIRNGYDIVVGWRQGRRENKVFLSKVYNFVCARLFGLHLHDMNWIKAFRREVIEDIELRSDWHRFILMLAAHRGYRITEVKTNWHPRRKGKSKFGPSRIPIALFDAMVIKFLFVFMDNPIRFFGFWGILLIILGSFIFILLILLWITTQTQLRPLMLLSLFSVLIGVFILMIGFLAEMIAMQEMKLDKIEQRLKKDEPSNQKS